MVPYSLRALSIEQLGRVVLARHPRPAVDHDHLVGAVLGDEPGADHRLERRRRPADLFLAEIDLDLGRDERRHDEGCDESRGHQSLHACLLWTRTALAKTSAGELRVALPWLVMIGSGLVHIPVQMLKVNDTSPILRIEREPRRQLPIVVVRTMWQLSWRSPKQPRSLEVKKGDRVQL